MANVKVRCVFCSKENKGKCFAKKGAPVKLLKSRKCGKYQEDPDKVLEEFTRVKKAPVVPLYKRTWRYYDEDSNNDGPLWVKVR